MGKRTLAATILFLLLMQANAQISVMKLVGNDTKDYSIGFGAFIRTGFPVSEGADVTLELGADIFFLMKLKMVYLNNNYTFPTLSILPRPNINLQILSSKK